MTDQALPDEALEKANKQVQESYKALSKANACFVETFITLCELVRRSNLVADTGPVWKTRRLFPATDQDKSDPDDLFILLCIATNLEYFILGIGRGDKLVHCLIPIDRWEDCYFADEIPGVIYSDQFSHERRLENLKHLYP